MHSPDYSQSDTPDYSQSDTPDFVIIQNAHSPKMSHCSWTALHDLIESKKLWDVKKAFVVTVVAPPYEDEDERRSPVLIANEIGKPSLVWLEDLDPSFVDEPTLRMLRDMLDFDTNNPDTIEPLTAAERIHIKELTNK
jgi:hypothetical protein